MLCTYWAKQTRPRFSELASAKNHKSASFFRYLLATMPAVFGRPGPDDDDDHAAAGEHGS